MARDSASARRVVIERRLLLLRVGVDGDELEAVGQRCGGNRSDGSCRSRSAGSGTKIGRRFVLLAQRLGALIIGRRDLRRRRAQRAEHQGHRKRRESFQGQSAQIFHRLVPCSRRVVAAGIVALLVAAGRAHLRSSYGGQARAVRSRRPRRRRRSCRGCAACSSARRRSSSSATSTARARRSRRTSSRRRRA